MTKRNLALAVALAALGAAWTAPAAAQESAADAEMDQANLGETVVTAARQDGKGTFVTRRGSVGWVEGHDGCAVHDDEYHEPDDRGFR